MLVRGFDFDFTVWFEVVVLVLPFGLLPAILAALKKRFAVLVLLSVCGLLGVFAFALAAEGGEGTIGAFAVLLLDGLIFIFGWTIIAIARFANKTAHDL